MTLMHTRMNVKIDLWGGPKRVEKALADDDFPSVPLLMNTRKIAKHTRLVAAEDKEVKKLHEAQQKDIAAQKSEQQKDDGKRKAEAKEGEGSKPKKKAKA